MNLYKRMESHFLFFVIVISKAHFLFFVFLFISMSKIHFLTKKHSISYTRQGWKDLIQYILHNELEISQKSEYKIKENERIYKISHQSLLCLPSQNISIIIQMNSILQYSIECIRLMMIPCLIQKERNRISTQKRVISKIDLQ